MNRNFRSITLRGVFSLILFMITSYGHASQKLIVPTEFSTIQSALNAANDMDTIFIENGTYSEKLILLLDKNITIEGNSENVIIDGSNQNRCLNVIGDTETLYSLSINNIKFINGYTDSNGGAINANNISLMLNNTIIENSYANTKGGAIYFEGDDISLVNCQILSNSSELYGGIYASCSNATLQYTSINKNLNEGSSPGESSPGGAKLIAENYSIEECNITGNEGYRGGGLWCEGEGTISNSSFTNNKARNWYGAAINTKGNVQIRNIEVINNISNYDAIIAAQGTSTISDSQFNDNMGAVFRSSGHITVENCHLLNNEIIVGFPTSNYITGLGNIIMKNNSFIYDANKNMGSDFQPKYAFKTSNNNQFQKIELNNCHIMGYDYGFYYSSYNFQENDSIKLHNSTISNCKYAIYNDNFTIELDSCNLSYNINAAVNKNQGILSINSSNIYENDFAVLNENESLMIDCKNNYWGHESGPLHPLFNTNGLGDETNEYVDVMPYSGQVNDIGVIHPINITSVNYLDDGFEINYQTYMSDVNKINIDIMSKYSDEQYSFVFDVNNPIIINDLISGQYLIYASYVTTEGLQSNKSFVYDFKYFKGEKAINVPEHYPNIETALAEAENGYSIYVADGTYNESINYVDFKKDVNLIGNPEHPENVIINGQGKGEGCLWIRGVYSQTGGKIIVDGFTLTNGSGYYCGAMRFDDVSMVEVNNCIVYGNTNSQGAIRFHSCTNSLLNHSLVYGNSGDYCGGIWSSRSDLIVDQSTIVHNSSSNQYYTSDLFAEYCNVEVNNSIIWNSNDYSININNANVLLNYCCLKSALLNQSITATNSIHSDPKFKAIEANDYSLSDDSPCIAAGDPNHELSIDGAINIGYYDNNKSTTIVDNINSESYKLFVSGNSITVEFKNVQPIIDLRVYDLSGKLVGSGKQINSFQIKYSLSDNKGVFIFHFRLKNSTVIEKILVKY